MKDLCVIAALGLAFLCGEVSAQIGAPADWRKESFTFPLQFAPSIPFEGIEHVRFSPTWSQFAGERGFTYVVLWDLKRRELQPQELERSLNVYFDGLMEAVTKAKKLEDPGTVSSASLHPMKAPDGWTDAYGGRLWTWNGFSRGEPLALHMEVTLRTCGTDRTQVFLAFSKQDRNGEAWQGLRDARKATPC